MGSEVFVPVEAELEREYVDYSAVEGFKTLSPLQKKIIEVHVRNPKLKRAQIAAKVGCSPPVVARVFASRFYELLSDEIAKDEKRYLRILALQVMRESLQSKDAKAKLKAALSILGDAGDLRDAPKTSNINKKIEVSWSSGLPAIPVKETKTIIDETGIQ